MMQLTKSFRKLKDDVDTEVGASGEIVSVTETVEIDDETALSIVSSLVHGDDEFQTASLQGRWDKLKERGTLVERNVEATGAGF